MHACAQAYTLTLVRHNYMPGLLLTRVSSIELVCRIPYGHHDGHELGSPTALFSGETCLHAVLALLVHPRALLVLLLCCAWCFIQVPHGSVTC
jgi:hypothetical protein